MSKDRLGEGFVAWHRERQGHGPEQIDRRTAGRGRGPSGERDEHDQRIEGVMRCVGREALPGRNAGFQRRRTTPPTHGDPNEGKGQHGEADRFVQLVQPVLQRAVAEILSS